MRDKVKDHDLESLIAVLYRYLAAQSIALQQDLPFVVAWHNFVVVDQKVR